MTKALVPISHDVTGKPTVNARDLHAFLGVGKVFANWIKDRIEQFGFVEHQDFVVIAEIGNNPKSGPPLKQYYLSLDMAKELSMVERNERGKQARQYFIECEKAVALSPAELMLRQTQLLVDQERKQRHLEAEIKAVQMETFTRLNRVEAILQDDPGYYSITGYANIIGIKINDEQAKVLGKAAAKLSRDFGIGISKIRHNRWGLVNGYHESVLKQIIGNPQLKAV
jgi:anti-repressor protein